MARNAITTLLSLAVAAWTVTQGDATRTCRIIGMIGMFSVYQMVSGGYLGCRGITYPAEAHWKEVRKWSGKSIRQ